MAWIGQRENKMLADWLRRTRAPMLATMPSGEILWCNHSFECLLGYNSVELVGRKTWKELTIGQEELSIDIQLVDETIAGKRTDYQLQKGYRMKSGESKDCLIDVIRYPLIGDFECFLVTVFPIADGMQFAMGQITQIRTLIIELMERQPSGLTFHKLNDFAKEHPVAFALAATFLATLLFGERVIQFVKLFHVAD